ncbi:MAG TPA: alkaline phosphatase family protein [Candidatus Sulfotelmatobacter sp.]|nr:alkaline phosphatase family protein [Candidatus Sulfotelmatobacter sp.]
MDIQALENQRNILIDKQAFLDNFVLPDYETLNVRNISSLVGKVFGINSLGSSIPNEMIDDYHGIEKVMLIVMDGFGYNRLLAHIKQDDGEFSNLVSKGVLKPLTSTFPATTSTSLTSIFTGLTPAEHSIIGYLMFSQTYGCVFITLDMHPVYGHSSDMEIAKDFSRRVKPWMPTLQMQGVNTSILTRGAIVGSGLSRITYADQPITPYVLESEMFVKARRILEQPGRVFSVLYFSGVDTLEHRYGPYSEEVTSMIQMFECLLRGFFTKLSDTTKKETLLMLTADHGVCETQKTMYLKDLPEITSRLQLPPVGDSRTAFLFAKQYEKENLRNVLEKNLGDFKLTTSEDLINAGAFGRSKDLVALQNLIGDFAVLSKCPIALSYPYYEDDRNHEQHGGHGGMTSEEIIVPLLSVRLSKI